MINVKGVFETTRERFGDFCRLCSLHGLMYLRNDIHLPKSDRVFWAVVFISSIIVSCLAISYVWHDWLQNPIMIVYDNNVSPIWSIPFPSITICSLVTVQRSVLDLQQTTDKDAKFLFTDNYPKDARFWSPETGFPPPDKVGGTYQNIFPRWATSPGYEEGLSIEIEQDMEQWQDLCSGSYSGFKVMVNSPEEAPITAGAALRVPMKRDFLVGLSPFVIRTAPELVTITPKTRGCLFQAERKLNFFGTYTQNNCLMECLLEDCLQKCGCVPFFMPRNSSTPVCNKDSDRICYRKAEDEMVKQNILENSDDDDDQVVPWCGCYPSCHDVNYNYVTNHGLFLKNYTTLAISERNNYAKISIYFKDSHYLGVHRQIQTTFHDFLGTCGGLLGLMMGFSCISAVEILYHLIIRPLGCFFVRKKSRKHFTTPISSSATTSYLRNKDTFKNYYF